jgi:hypothetical protein
MLIKFSFVWKEFTALLAAEHLMLADIKYILFSSTVIVGILIFVSLSEKNQLLLLGLLHVTRQFLT